MTDLAVAELTAEEAQDLTEEIRIRLDFLLPLIKKAFEGRADRALGYESWQAYCSAELSNIRVPVGDRPAMVAELRQSGMSQRAIGAAFGVSQETVRRDLATDTNVSVEAPATITSLDGRERPASRPPTSPTQSPGPVEADAAPSADPGADLRDLVIGALPVDGSPLMFGQVRKRIPQPHTDREIREVLYVLQDAGMAVCAQGEIALEWSRIVDEPQPVEPRSTPEAPQMTPEQREERVRESETRRMLDLGRREARDLVLNIRNHVVAILAAANLGETNLINPQMIAAARESIDLLEGRMEAAA